MLRHQWIFMDFWTVNAAHNIYDSILGEFLRVKFFIHHHWITGAGYVCVACVRANTRYDGKFTLKCKRCCLDHSHTGCNSPPQCAKCVKNRATDSIEAQCKKHALAGKCTWNSFYTNAHMWIIQMKIFGKQDEICNLHNLRIITRISYGRKQHAINRNILAFGDTST